MDKTDRAIIGAALERYRLAKGAEGKNAWARESDPDQRLVIKARYDALVARIVQLQKVYPCE